MTAIPGAKPTRHGKKYYSSRFIVSPERRIESATEKTETILEAEERTEYVAKLRSQDSEVSPLAVNCWYDTPGADAEGGVVLDHMNWCKIASLTYVSEVCESSNPASCTEVGRVKFRVRYIGEGNQGNAVSDRKANVTVVLDDPKPTGAPRMTDSLTISGVCDRNTSGTPACGPGGTATRPLGTWMTPEGGTAWIEFTSSEGSLGDDKLGFYGFGVKFASPQKTFTESGTAFRCDSASYLNNKFGCVFKDVNDVFTLTVDSEVKESADLIWTAQNQPDKTFPVTESRKKIPGSVASGEPLQRTNEANLDGNRAESIKQCKIFFGERYSRGTNRDCDEYPYASTRQGSKIGAAGTSHYAIKALNKSHNQKAGNRLNSFYEQNRILRDEDSFYVKLVDSNGNAYKGPAKPTGVAAPVTYRTCENNSLPEVQAIETEAPPVNRLLNYAKNTPDGWTGGDSTYSVKLPDGRIAYIFSDTFLGPLNSDGTRPTNAKLVNSSIVIDDNGSLSTITGGTKNRPKALMPPAIDNRWYWLGDAMIADIDDAKYLQIMFQEYRGTNDGSALPFAFARNVVATFSLNDLTAPIWIDPLPSDTSVAWGSALTPASRSGDGYTYIYGVSNDKTNKKMRIARVKGNDLSQVDDWQFLNTAVTGNNWMRAETDGNDSLPGIANEYSVTPWNGQFVLISQDSTLAFSNKIHIWSACDPFGPFGFWVDHNEVYRMPETGPWGSYGDQNIFAYNPHVHPVLQSGDRWTLSYNVNSFDNRVSESGIHYRDPGVYKPRFISFRLVPAAGTRSSKQFVLDE